MPDHLLSNKRSWNMSRILSKNTSPELLVRKYLHKNGFRFRIHRKDLPGKPDIVLSKYNTVIFVHGCFWHRHKNCKRCTTPKSNIEYWKNKFNSNINRDEKNYNDLINNGWKVIIIWECEAKIEKNLDNLIKKLKGD